MLGTTKQLDSLRMTQLSRNFITCLPSLPASHSLFDRPSMGNATSSNENPLTSIFSSIIGTLLDIGYDALDLLYQSGLAPRTLCSSPVLLNAEVFTALSTLGASTVLDPTGSASFDILPKNFNINASVQIFNSKTYMNFFNFTPSAFSFKYTNQVGPRGISHLILTADPTTGQAALGSLLSDTTNFISILQLSVGFFKGSPVVEKVGILTLSS
jgi:hypothetical protein